MDDGLLLKLGFGTDGNASAMLREGWSIPENGFMWTVGAESILLLMLPRLVPRAWMSLWLFPHLAPPALPAQRLTVLVNNVPVTDVVLTGGRDRIDLAIPPAALTLGSLLVVTLRHPDAAAPAALGTGPDIRTLAIAVRACEIYDRPPDGQVEPQVPATQTDQALTSDGRPLLAVCAIARNESRYIYEWLAFHYHIGVRRFVIYDNGTTDTMLDEIGRFPEHACVTVIPWPGAKVQVAAYNDMIANHHDVAEWCAFIDCDEFICPRNGVATLDFISGLDPACNGIYMHWMMFGSSGASVYQPLPVTERFTRRGHESFGPNAVGKTLVRLSAALAAESPHVITCRGHLVNDAGSIIDPAAGGLHHTISHEKIAVFHYFTKSLQEWHWRRSAGRADKAPDESDFIRTEQEFRRHDVNDVVDTTAATIMQEVKRRFY